MLRTRYNGTVFQHRFEGRVPFGVATNWFILSFLAGSVNVGGLMGCHRFVTHVTGFATLAGLDLAQARWPSALATLSVPLFFLLGVIIAALLVDRRIHQKKAARYAAVMLLSALCLCAVAVGGIYDYFGPFGATVNLKKDYTMLALLCMASGLQNAAITSASGATVRTTHLTGLTTDFGLSLVRAFYTKEDRKKRAMARYNNFLRLGTLLSFVLGSAVGAVLFMEVAYLGFFLPAGIAFYAAFQELQRHSH